MKHSSEWPLVTFGDLLKTPLLNGNHQMGMRFGSGTRIVRMVDLYRGDIINTKKLDRVEYPVPISDEYQLIEGDILLNRTSLKREGVGKAALVLELDEPCYFDCSIIRARPDTHKVNPRYLLYVLNSSDIHSQMMGISKTVTITTISQPDVIRLLIPKPPLPEQERITAILMKAECLCRLRHYTHELSDKYLHSVFLEMFGDPMINPKGWDRIFLEKLAYGHNGIVDGPYGSSINTEIDYTPEGEIPVIRTKNVGVFEFIEDDLKFIARKKFESLMRSRVVPGDIVLTKVGTIGQMCIFPNHFKEAVLSTTGSCKITPDTNQIDRTVLLHCLYAMRDYMNQVASQAVQSFLNMTMVKEIPIILPPRPLQDRFAAIASRFNRLRAQQYEAERQADHLFQTLLHKALRGELTRV